jgi:hypothetical protein
MKLNLKSAGKSVMTNGKEVGLTLGGALLSRKFLDFDVMMKNQPADSFMRKHQGIIKFLVGTIGAGMVKQNSMLRPILNGVALEGGIKAVRTYGGGSFFPQLGEDSNLLGDGAQDGLLGDYELAEILAGADDMGADDMGSVVNEYPSSVSGGGLTENAFSSVAGVSGVPSDDMGAGEWD